MDRPPPHNTTPPDPNALGNILLILQYLTFMVGTFWTLVTRKRGTVGTRFYSMYVFGCMFTLAILIAGTRQPLDFFMLNGTMLLFLFLYVSHLTGTQASRNKGKHVHTWALGKPTLGNEGWTLLFGLALAVPSFLIAPTFGCFLGASVLCSGAMFSIIEGRDQMRVNQMLDAEIEQERLLEKYERARDRLQQGQG